MKELMVFPETHGQNLNPVLSNRVSALTTERLLYQEEKNCTLPKSPEIAWQVLKGKCYDGRQNMIRNLIAYDKTFNEFETLELSTNKSLLSGFLLYCFWSKCLGSKNK